MSDLWWIFFILNLMKENWVDDSLLYLASQDCSLFSFLPRVKFPLFFFWVSQGRPIFSKGVSSDSSIFPSLWFLTGKEWYRGRVCWVGFKLSLLYFPLPMVPYGAGVTEGPHLLGGFWVKFALSQFRFLYLPLSQFIEVGFQLSLLYLRFWVRFALSQFRFLYLPL